MYIHRSEFLKEKNQPKTVPPLNAGPSTAAAYSQTPMTSSSEGSSSSCLQEPAPEASTPQIKPYTRKRPRDTSNEIPSESSKLSALSSSLSTVVEGEGRRGGGEVGGMGVESMTDSLEVKPYVRKRKIKPKN